MTDTPPRNDEPTIVAGSTGSVPRLPGAGPAPGGLVGLELNGLFELTRFIAQGGMGEVYEGRNIHSGERVAIKVILAQFAADEKFMEMFRREASILERIGHDALVKYRTLAFDRTAQLTYLATEFVDGPPLSERLRGKPADPAEVAQLVRRLAAGLGAAHGAGVIHRDLSPDNVLLPGDRVERAKIIDFGIARGGALDEKSIVGTAFAGKFGYAAPEIFGKYRREIGPWTDVYSLALLVLAFAYGRPLDMGTTVVDALAARDTVPDLSFLPARYVPLFSAMLEPDPAVRLRSMEAVVAMLDGAGAPAPAATVIATAEPMTLVSSKPAVAMPAAPSPAEPAPAARSGPSGLVIGGAAAAILAAGVGGYLLLGRGEQTPAVPTPPAPPAIVAAPQAAATAPAPWSSVQGEVAAALRGVPCSDLRIDGTPTGGIVRVSGWRPDNVSIPNAVGGWSIDARGAAAVAAPSPETCSLVARLGRTLGGPEAARLGFPAERTVSMADLPRTPDGLLLPGLTVTERPSALGALTVVTIEDRPRQEANRVAAATLSGGDVEGQLGAVPYSAYPARYLIYLIARKGPKPFDFVVPRDLAGVARECEAGKCASTSGWLDVR